MTKQTPEDLEQIRAEVAARHDQVLVDACLDQLAHVPTLVRHSFYNVRDTAFGWMLAQRRGETAEHCGVLATKVADEWEKRLCAKVGAACTLCGRP